MDMTRTEMIERLSEIAEEYQTEYEFMDSSGRAGIVPTLNALDQAILILEHISPRELARCLEVARKKQNDES